MTALPLWDALSCRRVIFSMWIVDRAIDRFDGPVRHDTIRTKLAITISLIGTAPTSEAKVRNCDKQFRSRRGPATLIPLLSDGSFELIGTTVRPACHAPQSATR